MTELEDAEPVETEKLYLDHREGDASYDALLKIKKGLKHFRKWVNENDIENLNNLTGRDLLAFKNWRKSQDIKYITLNGTLAVLRRYLKFGAQIEAVPEDLPGKVPDTPISDEDEVRKDPPSEEEVNGVEEYLKKYRYASRQHTTFKIIREYGNRQGAVRGLDEGDYYPQEMALSFRHRPADSPKNRGTPLKNGSDSERSLNVPSDLNDLLIDYINNPERPSGTDKFGRSPLFTSIDNQGVVRRIGINRIRDDFYKFTRPCEYRNQCPLDRDRDSCEAAKNRHASKCPENWTPHRLRTFAIMEQLGDGMTYDLVTDRVDVSMPVLKKHYDHRSMERKRIHRLDKVKKYRDRYDNNPTSTPAQADISEWSKAGFPPLSLLFVTSSIFKTTVERLKKELAVATPGPTTQITVDKEKARKAAALYPVFVVLVGMNIALIFS
mgnify:CR=1 FL=1